MPGCAGPAPVAEAGLTPAAAAYGWLFAVTEASPNKDEVYAFLNWLNTDVLPDGRPAWAMYWRTWLHSGYGGRPARKRS